MCRDNLPAYVLHFAKVTALHGQYFAKEGKRDLAQVGAEE